ncbi:MAG: hypothetical protein ACK491_11500 [Pseudanabaena sp.]
MGNFYVVHASKSLNQRLSVSVSETLLESISVESIPNEALANLDLTDFSLS